jgi:predicted SAM-dependent methyltransferase
MSAKRKYFRRVAAPKIHVPVPTLKLDLGCGQNPKEGFEGVDRFAPNAKHKVHLWSGERWPWADSSVDELHAAHLIEHIDAVYLPDGTDALLWFFDEAWRVAKPGATFSLQWPALQSVRAFQDPTHRRFIPPQTMAYLDKNWRQMQKLDHYLGGCDWVYESGASSCSIENSKKPAEVQTKLAIETWNFAEDLFAVLRCRKP